MSLSKQSMLIKTCAVTMSIYKWKCKLVVKNEVKVINEKPAYKIKYCLNQLVRQCTFWMFAYGN